MSGSKEYDSTIADLGLDILDLYKILLVDAKSAVCAQWQRTLSTVVAILIDLFFCTKERGDIERVQ